MPLTTLANVKSFLNISGTGEDARLELFRQAAEAAFLKAIDRSIELSTYVETFDGYWQDGLTLRNSPIASITSLQIREFDGVTVTVPVTDYRVGNGSILYLVPSAINSKYVYFAGERVRTEQDLNWVRRPYRASVVATYVGGYDPVPMDIQLAIAQAVGSMRLRAPTGGEVQSEGYEDYSYSLGGLSAEAEMLRLGGVKSVIDSYRFGGVAIA